MAGTGQVRPYNMFKALVLIVGAAIASYASQLSLGPVYGDIPTSLYHEKICAGVFAGAWIGRILFGRVVPRPLALLTILAYYTPAIQRYAFRYSEEWGPYKGPVITEALTFYPQLFLAVLSSSVLLNSSNILFDAVPAGICFAVFRNVRAIIPGVMASHIGSNWLLTRCGLTHISAMVFNLFTSSAAVLATLVPAIAYSALLNPQCSNTAAVSYLNETIAASNYTLLSRRESITGYVSIMENTYHGYRMLRCDHSILGGEWQRAPPGFEHMETGIKEPIYSVFVMLEAVRLIEPGPVNKKPKALMMYGSSSYPRPL